MDDEKNITLTIVCDEQEALAILQWRNAYCVIDDILQQFRSLRKYSDLEQFADKRELFDHLDDLVFSNLSGFINN